MTSIEVISTGMLDVNCSIISNLQTREVFLVDPGGDEDIIYNIIQDHHLTLKAILHTHGHFDHILGTPSLIKKYYRNRNDIQIYLHAEDQFLWDNLSIQSQKFGIQVPDQDMKITDYLNHNQMLDLCGMKIQVKNSPGHSPGSCTFFITKPDVENPVLIVGDVIFQNSIGRTDLWKGDYATLLKSIHENVLSYPDDTRIIPGHGFETTVGEERLHNPFLAG